MRVQLEVGNKTVDVEDNTNPYQTASEKKMFLTLLRDALKAVGYTEIDLLKEWSTKEE